MRLLAEHTVPDSLPPQRIYDYCVGLFEQLPSRKSVKKAIDKGEILLNHQKTETGWWLKGGEQIQLVDLDQAKPKLYRLPLDVLFEDDHIAVVVKPAGLLTNGNTFKTVTNALQHNLTGSPAIDAMPWPKPVHRLDKATSGILIIAKTKTAHMKLSQQFEKGEVKKKYHAVVLGKLEGSGIINEQIDNKAALTEFESMQTVKSLRSNYLSLVRLSPKTGRTHQLRKHLSGIGHAILGDAIYSPSNLYLQSKGLFLCASEISFKHPDSQVIICYNIDMPAKFLKRLKSEEKRWLKRN